MNNNTFIAVDFETSNCKRMICQIGLTIVKDGVIVETINKLIQPPGNTYDDNCIKVHGITPDMTKFMPTFDIVWEEIKNFLVGVDIIAHNASFDEDALYKNLDFYGILPLGISQFFCTYKLFKDNLKNVCKFYGIDMGHHHNAGDDSRCCALAYLEYLNGKNYIPAPKRHHEVIKGDVLVKDLTNANPNNPFYDRKIVITGEFIRSRKEIASILKQMGADVDTSITKKTNFVLVGDNAGPQKMSKIKDLKFNGYEIKILKEVDFDNILCGNYDDYMTDKNSIKKIHLEYSHYETNKVHWDYDTNILSTKEIFVGNGLNGRDDIFKQIIGNLGGYANSYIEDDTHFCLLSNKTIDKLKNGILDETLTRIQEFYNSNKSQTFELRFITENDIIDFAKSRIKKFGDKCLEHLLGLYDN